MNSPLRQNLHIPNHIRVARSGSPEFSPISEVTTDTDAKSHFGVPVERDLRKPCERLTLAAIGKHWPGGSLRFKPLNIGSRLKPAMRVYEFNQPLVACSPAPPV